MTEHEKVARALCKADGFDPDAMVLPYPQPALGAKGHVLVSEPVKSYALYWRQAEAVLNTIKVEVA